MTVLTPKAIRVATAAGWQDVAIQGPAGEPGEPGAAGSAGPAGLSWKGAWSAATAYAVNDAVTYGGSSYRRLVATPDPTKTLTYASDGDTNGLIYHLGATLPGTAFAAPAPTGDVNPAVGTHLTISSYATPSAGWFPGKLVDRNSVTGVVNMSSTAGQYMRFDLKTRTLAPSRVAMQVRSDVAPSYNLIGFVIEGSNDGSAFTTLLTVADARSTGAWTQGGWKTFAITGAASYRYLQLRITTATTSGDYYIALAEMEWYGTLTDPVVPATAPAVDTTNWEIIAAKGADGSGGSGVGASTIQGIVNANGTIARGSDFTVVRAGVGDYTITFTKAFANPPVVTFSILTAGSSWQYITATGGGAGALPTTTSFKIAIYNSSTGMNVDAAFEFLAVDGVLGAGGSGGTGGAVRTRGAVLVNEIAMSAGESRQINVALAECFELLKVAFSATVRFRLYASTAYRTADLARLAGTDPRGDHGVILELITGAGEFSFALSPIVIGASLETVATNLIPATITATSAGNVTGTFDWLRIA